MNYTKQCWSCGKDTMVNQGDYHQCSECGATWNEPPHGGEYLDIERRRGATGGGLKYSPVIKRA